MKPENFDKAKELLEELEELIRYKDIINSKKSNVAHFVLALHYGNLSDYEKVSFRDRHTKLFIPIVEKIIEDIKNQLKEM